jgi:glycerol-3-phosphate acyltransferase PlsX
MKIAVDAMGGDYAPEVVVKGAIDAVREYKTEVVLVGDEAKITPLLKKAHRGCDRIYVQHASETIGMSESAALSVRRKRDSSIVVGIGLVKQGKADAFVSAGNTGAVVCAGTLGLGMLPGIERPGIGMVMPSLRDITMLIDVGANINPKPTQLLQYGIMADSYFRCILNRDNPSVGLLNVGEEESKGTGFYKETRELFDKSKLNFIGNVEGKDIFSGKTDIIVCDGFVGNVALKTSESLAEMIQDLLKSSLLKNPLGIFGLLLLKNSLQSFKKKVDYSEYGGAPLLGVNGVVIIGHGRSNANAVKNAIRVARAEVENRFTDRILGAIGKS